MEHILKENKMSWFNTNINMTNNNFCSTTLYHLFYNDNYMVSRKLSQIYKQYPYSNFCHFLLYMKPDQQIYFWY